MVSLDFVTQKSALEFLDLSYNRIDLPPSELIDSLIMIAPKLPRLKQINLRGNPTLEYAGCYMR